MIGLPGSLIGLFGLIIIGQLISESSMITLPWKEALFGFYSVKSFIIWSPSDDDKPSSLLLYERDYYDWEIDDLSLLLESEGCWYYASKCWELRIVSSFHCSYSTVSRALSSSRNPLVLGLIINDWLFSFYFLNFCDRAVDF